MTRFMLAIGCAIALVSTLKAQVPAPPPPPAQLLPSGPAALAPANPFAQKFEYEFVTKPRGTDAFKKLLKERGKDGWEYVGLIPDGDELIFKKATAGGASMVPPALPPGGVGTPPAIGVPGIAPPKPLTPPGLPGVPPVKELIPPKE